MKPLNEHQRELAKPVDQRQLNQIVLPLRRHQLKQINDEEFKRTHDTKDNFKRVELLKYIILM